MEQKKIQSPVFWAGMIAAIAFFAKSFFEYDLPQDQLNLLVEAVLSLIAAFGIGNNPNSKSHF